VTDDQTSLEQRVVAALGAQYEIECEIGRGGMSVVYRARDRRLDRLVAVKALPPELAYDPAIRTRFTREAQTSAQLAHPHIVPIYDVGERDGIAYFVMSLVRGGSLADLLAREPRLPIARVRTILVELADALAFAHLRGVIHRDVKPDNVLIDGDSGRSMVTDFGIARAIEAGTRLTVTGNAVGTPTYMSPEQAMGERELDGRSDIYSLGVLGYQMLTGRVPFEAGNSMALLLKHVSETPRPISELRPDVPPALRDVIERAMLKQPADRWPTATSMRDALRSGETSPSSSWRVEQREPVRYTTPRPRGSRGSGRSAAVSAPSPRRGTPVIEAGRESLAPQPRAGIERVAPHLVALTAEQREDLRLWKGRIDLLDRVKSIRGNFWLAIGTTVLGLGCIAGVNDVPPLILAPIVPVVLWVRFWKRGKSLRASGLRLRRVLRMPRARQVLPRSVPGPEEQLESLAPREVLDSTYGGAIRRAAGDSAAILEIMRSLKEADRALLPDLRPTVDALVERVAQLAVALHRLDPHIDLREAEDLDARIGAMEGASAGMSASPDDERRLALLRRQRDTRRELAERRVGLLRQLENAVLALGSLRLDLIKLRSSGGQAGLTDVSSATEEVRALSRDIDVMLEAAADVRDL
jgi:serine/threonine protein kinase